MVADMMMIFYKDEIISGAAVLKWVQTQRKLCEDKTEKEVDEDYEQELATDEEGDHEEIDPAFLKKFLAESDVSLPFFFDSV